MGKTTTTKFRRRPVEHLEDEAGAGFKEGDLRKKCICEGRRRPDSEVGPKERPLGGPEERRRNQGKLDEIKLSKGRRGGAAAAEDADRLWKKQNKLAQDLRSIAGLENNELLQTVGRT
eukprot:5101851-Pleurochrysis_carterae.AAC.1